jgi:hypothetical protein
MTPQRRNSHYKRIFGIGLGISVAVHAAVLGFGRLSMDTSGKNDGDLNVITLPQPEPENEIRHEEDALDAGIPGGVKLSEVESEIPGIDLNDYPIVLARLTSEEPAAPLVPRPRIRPHMVESGLTPIHRLPQPAMTTLAESGRPAGRGGMGIGIVVLGPGGPGVDTCHPTGHGRPPRQFQPGIYRLRIGGR